TGLGTATISLQTALPDVTEGVHINAKTDAVGKPQLTVTRGSTAPFRILNITASGAESFSVTGVRFTNGNAGSENGGDVAISIGKVTFSHCEFSGGTAVNGGGISVGTGGALTLSSCLVRDNTAESGGGIYSLDFASFTMQDSLVTGRRGISPRRPRRRSL